MLIVTVSGPVAVSAATSPLPPNFQTYGRPCGLDVGSAGHILVTPASQQYGGEGSGGAKEPYIQNSLQSDIDMEREHLVSNNSQVVNINRFPSSSYTLHIE